MSDWKLVQTKKQDELYNLAKYVGGTADLSKNYPKVVDLLVKHWEAYRIKG